MNSLYDTPEQLDLYQLFYCGSGLEESRTKTEEDAVVAYNGWELKPDCACEKISRANMDAVLAEYTGLTLADTDGIGLEKFTYLEEYDAYYFFHGDTNYRGSVAFSGGEREGELIRLFYEDGFMADGDKVLTLREHNGGYLFVSNLKRDLTGLPKVLVVTFNRALVAYMKGIQSPCHGITVESFHRFALGYLKSAGKETNNCVIREKVKFK